MLIRAEALEKAGGLEPMRGALIDDVALGTLLKKNGNRIWLGLTTDIRSDRPYPSLGSLWHMIARSAYVQLRYNPALLAGTLVGLLLLYAVPPAGVIAALIAAGRRRGSAPPPQSPGSPACSAGRLMTASYLPMLRLLPAVAAARARAAADRAHVRGDDGRLRPTALLGPGRLLARPRRRPGLTRDRVGSGLVAPAGAVRACPAGTRMR